MIFVSTFMLYYQNLYASKFCICEQMFKLVLAKAEEE